MSLSPIKKPLVLVILDGWGHKEHTEWNAISKAQTPQWDAWWASKPHMLLEASGTAVGLPAGQMGNSEVGHMHIGAGRVLYQDLTKINQAINDGGFFNNPTFITTLKGLKKTKKTLHIMGLLSDGGVHSHEAHLFAFLKLCQQQASDNCVLHLFLDGRDSPPKSALNSLKALDKQLMAYPVATIGSISGRYYAMDRDERWERTKPVYEVLTTGHAEQSFDTASGALATYYAQGLSDEFIPPTKIGKATPMVEGDGLFFFNFRPDRARQLTSAFLKADFKGFERKQCPVLSQFVSMTGYAKDLPTQIAFPQNGLNNSFAEVIAQQGLRQLRIAETEKYAHVTYFFNGGLEQAFLGEERILVPSPKVNTYDLQPEMSAWALTQALVAAVHTGEYDVIICNYANADMVGHTGDLKAAIVAIEHLDHCLHTVWKAIEAQTGALLITSDHGNAEVMFDELTQQAHTAHTSGPVPLLFIGDGWHFIQDKGSLIDVAPTLLKLLGIPQPAEMTGLALLEADDHGRP